MLVYLISVATRGPNMLTFCDEGSYQMLDIADFDQRRIFKMRGLCAYKSPADPRWQGRDMSLKFFFMQ